MSLFKRAIQAHYPNVVDVPIQIGGLFNCVIDNPAVREALDAIQEEHISKQDLLNIWEDESRRYSFKTKFLLTLFWGHVKPINLMSILADNDLDLKLSDLERALHGFEDFSENTIDKHHPYDDIQELYTELECGCLHIKGLGVSFFTKVFFFFFATHRTFFSQKGIQIIIADDWMKKAVFAELSETSPEMVKEIFRPKTKNPFWFRSRRNTTSKAYFDFLKVFEMRMRELQLDYPELDGFSLESYIFGSRDLIATFYDRIISH